MRRFSRLLLGFWMAILGAHQAEAADSVAAAFTAMQAEVRTSLDAHDPARLWQALHQTGIATILHLPDQAAMTQRLTPGSTDLRLVQQFLALQLVDVLAQGTDHLLTTTIPGRQSDLRVYLTLSQDGSTYRLTSLRANTGLTLQSANSRQVALGAPAPDFQARDATGQVRSLREWAGKTIVVNFWATWCPPCVREVPLLQQLYEQYKDRDVVVIGLNAEMEEDKAQRFAAQHMTYPALFGAGEASSAYGVVAIPATFFIDQAGVVRRADTGGVPSSGFEALAGRLLDVLPR